MNPLSKKQIKKLEELGCSDLARKIDEIVQTLNNGYSEDKQDIGDFIKIRIEDVKKFLK